MATPTAAVLAAFAAGVCALQTAATLPAHPFALALAGLVALAACRALARRPPARRRACGFAAACAAAASACALGFGYAAWRAEVRLAEALPPAWEGVDVALVGVVDDLPAATARGTRFAFAVERVDTPGAVVPSRVSLAWPAPWPGNNATTMPPLHTDEH